MLVLAAVYGYAGVTEAVRYLASRLTLGRASEHVSERVAIALSDEP